MAIQRHEIPLPTTHAVIKHCHSEGIPVILNPAPFYPTPEELSSAVDVVNLPSVQIDEKRGRFCIQNFS